MSNQRPNFMIGFIGTNRTGKSSTAVEVAKAWRDSRPDVKKNPIIAFDPQQNFQNILTAEIEPEDEDWPERCMSLRNALIILDDFKLLNEGTRPVKGLMNLLYFRAKYNIDIIHVCHNPGLLINAITGFTNMYYIFYTPTVIGSFKQKIPNYELCSAASKQVNDYVSVYGRGSYPKFPYAIVDCEAQKIKCVNMDRGLSKLELKK